MSNCLAPDSNMETNIKTSDRFRETLVGLRQVAKCDFLANAETHNLEIGLILIIDSTV
jgi:hypothetical protein